MTPKEYLSQYKWLLMKEQNIQDEIDAICTRYIGRAIQYSDMPKAFSSEHDLSDYIVEIDPLLKQLDESKRKAVEAYRRIEQEIERLEDEREKTLLRLRYLCCMSWEDVASTMHYDVRWVFQLHGRALKSFVHFNSV